MDLSFDTDAPTLTNKFCAHLAEAQYSDLSLKAIHEARRGVLDWLGCALAGSRHPTIDKLLDVLREAGGKPQATVFARGMKLGFLDAPLANGQMGHLLEWDKSDSGLTEDLKKSLFASYTLVRRPTAK